MSVVTLFLAGCAEIPDIEEVADETIVVTLWTDSFELFMEFPPLRVGQSARFAAHLTNLITFEPVVSGPVTFEFLENGKTVKKVTLAEPLRPGIFVPEIIFERPVVMSLHIGIESPSQSGTIEVSPVQVYGPNEETTPIEEVVVQGDPITYLKEQQWKLPFRTELVSARTLRGSVALSGKTLARPGGDFRVVPPLAGRFISPDEGPPILGQRVQSGQLLGWIEPPLPKPEEVAMESSRVQTTLSLVQLEERIAEARAAAIARESEHALAQRELERLDRLFQIEAVPERRVHAAASGLAISQANLRAAQDNLQTLSEAQSRLASTPDEDKVAQHRLPLHAPGSGTVVQSTAASGAFIGQDEVLFRIVDLSLIWIRAEVHETEVDDIQGAGDAEVRLPDGSSIAVDKTNGRLLLVGDVLDPETRTLPIVWEVANPYHVLKVGLLLEIQLFSSETVQGLAVPASAIFREDNKSVVYVHVGGETFDRRIVETGVEDSGMVQILTGLSPDERVVIEGGYEVGLAGRSTEGAGEGHVH
jgi:membrane fusion protein, heavy metal efflux system